MAEPGYGGRFVVFDTERGFRFTTNEHSIRIMGLLFGSSMAIVDIARELGIPKTSVQSSVSTLVGMGLLDSVADPADGRRTLYYPTCAVGLMSAEPDPEAQTMFDEIVCSLPGWRSSSMEAVMLTGLRFMAAGIDIGPRFGRAGAILGHRFRDLYESGTDAGFFSRMEGIFRGAGTPECRFSLEDGGAVAVELDGFDRPQYRFVLRGLAGFAATAASEHFGCEYVADLPSMRFGGGRSSFRVKRYPGPAYGHVGVPRDFYRPGTGRTGAFSIYGVGGRPILFGNPMQIEIMRLLAERPMTLTRLAEEMDAVPVTVHTNVAKLAALGAVGTESGSSVKNALYRLQAEPILVRTEGTAGSHGRLERMLEAIRGDRGGRMMFRFTFFYVFHAFRCAGCDATYQIGRAGEAVARVLLEGSEAVTAEGYIESFLEVAEGFGFRCRMKSLIPLAVEMDGSVPDEDLLYAVPFLDGVLRRGLLELTGHEYPVTFAKGPRGRLGSRSWSCARRRRTASVSCGGTRRCPPRPRRGGSSTA